jgi:hypothetical protein
MVPVIRSFGNPRPAMGRGLAAAAARRDSNDRCAGKPRKKVADGGAHRGSAVLAVHRHEGPQWDKSPREN